MRVLLGVIPLTLVDAISSIIFINPQKQSQSPVFRINWHQCGVPEEEPRREEGRKSKNHQTLTTTGVNHLLLQKPEHYLFRGKI